MKYAERYERAERGEREILNPRKVELAASNDQMRSVWPAAASAPVSPRPSRSPGSIGSGDVLIGGSAIGNSCVCLKMASAR